MTEEKNLTNTIEEKFKSKPCELQVVKYVLTEHPESMSQVDIAWFSIKPLKRILQVLKKLRIPLTRETLTFELKKMGAFKAGKIENSLESIYVHYIKEVFNVSLSCVNQDTFKLLCKQLFELSESRKYLEITRDIVKGVDNFDVDKVKDRLQIFSSKRFAVQDELTGNFLDDYEVRRDKLLSAEKNTKVIPTGLTGLDAKIGGLMQSEWGMLIGRTGIGKTATMLCMAVHAWMEGYNVFIATGEMRKILIQYRLDANIATIESNKFRTGNIDSEDLKRWDIYIEALRAMQESFLEIEAFPEKFSALAVQDKIKYYEDKHGQAVDIAFLDYLNIMEPNYTSGGLGDWTTQLGVVKDVKTLVETHNNGHLRAWTVGQIKDEFYDAERLTATATKYGRAISEWVPLLLGLVRTQDDILFNTMQLQFIKTRNATPFDESIILYPEFNYMRLHSYNRHGVKNFIESNDKEEKE